MDHAAWSGWALVSRGTGTGAPDRIKLRPVGPLTSFSPPSPGFPTINWFATGESQAEAYQGARDAGALEAFALARWAATAPPPEVRRRCVRRA